MNQKLEFSFDGLPVGHFEDRAPFGAGRYRYMPYRGPGHLKMGEVLRGGAHARCVFTDGKKRYEFLVTGVPEYGVLEIEKVSPS